jgi:hypothetical protein
LTTSQAPEAHPTPSSTRSLRLRQKQTFRRVLNTSIRSFAQARNSGRVFENHLLVRHRQQGIVDLQIEAGRR